MSSLPFPCSLLLLKAVRREGGASLRPQAPKGCLEPQALLGSLLCPQCEGAQASGLPHLRKFSFLSQKYVPTLMGQKKAFGSSLGNLALHFLVVGGGHLVQESSQANTENRGLWVRGLGWGSASGVSPLLPLLALDRVIQFACFTALGGESLQVALLPGLHTPGTSRVLSHELPGLGDRPEPSARASWGGTI